MPLVDACLTFCEKKSKGVDVSDWTSSMEEEKVMLVFRPAMTSRYAGIAWVAGPGNITFNDVNLLNVTFSYV